MGGNVTTSLPHAFRCLQQCLSSYMMGVGSFTGTGVPVCCVNKACYWELNSSELEDDRRQVISPQDSISEFLKSG